MHSGGLVPHRSRRRLVLGPTHEAKEAYRSLFPVQRTKPVYPCVLSHPQRLCELGRFSAEDRVEHHPYAVGHHADGCGDAERLRDDVDRFERGGTGGLLRHLCQSRKPACSLRLDGLLCGGSGYRIVGVDCFQSNINII